jgi:aspartate-semialdehyde dehydrogenase
MADSGLDIAIIGATGAVGADLIEAFERSSIDVARFIPVASATRVHPPVDVGGARYTVLPVTGDTLPEKVLDEADLVVFATPASVTRTLAPAVIEAGIAIIDVGGALLDQGVIAVPLAGVAVDGDLFTDRRVACSPSGPAVLAATVLRPLKALGMARAQMTVMMPAGGFGRGGAEELSRQVVALFNGADPPRSLFPDGLAFDLIAALGTPTDDWTGAERRLSAEIAALLRIAPTALPASIVVLPTFAGVSISAVVRLQPGVGAEQVRAALDAIPTITIQDPVVSPQNTIGTATAHVGRIRDDPGGEGVHLWASADNLRFGASANVLAIASQLWRENLL